MRLLIAILAIVALGGCQSGSPPLDAGSRDEQTPPAGPMSTGASVTLVVSLTQTSQGPSPAGLPTRLEVSGPIPAEGEEASISWRALDGAADVPPRAGTGSVSHSPGEQLIFRLRRSDGPSDEALVLTGARTGDGIQGSFADGLFYPRAGLFDGRRS